MYRIPGLSIRKILSSFLALAFVLTSVVPSSYAGLLFDLPVPGTMVPASAVYSPVLLKGITVYPDDPFRFDFIVDSGNFRGLVRPEAEKLVRYFLASMTVPSKDLWVNLSPVEKDRIIPDALIRTELGQGLLAQDYMLKQVASTLMYPEADLGKEFWARVYAQAQEKYGITDIPTDTFNKVWITPDTATIYEKGHMVYVVNARLKVMLESDYLVRHRTDLAKSPESLATREVMREIILPAMEKEVNTGKNFAPLRQIYFSLILAKWYKQKIKDSLLSRKYIDQNKVQGIDLSDPEAKQEIYDRYMQAYKKGVYNYVKEAPDPVTQEVVPRKYFSGGFQDKALTFSRTDSAEEIASSVEGKDAVLRVRIDGVPRTPVDNAVSRDDVIQSVVDSIQENFSRDIDLDLDPLAIKALGRTYHNDLRELVLQGDEDAVGFITDQAVHPSMADKMRLVNDLERSNLSEDEVRVLVSRLAGMKLKVKILLPAEPQWSGARPEFETPLGETIIARYVRALNPQGSLDQRLVKAVAAFPLEDQQRIKVELRSVRWNDERVLYVVEFFQKKNMKDPEFTNAFELLVKLYHEHNDLIPTTLKLLEAYRKFQEDQLKEIKADAERMVRMDERSVGKISGKYAMPPDEFKKAIALADYLIEVLAWEKSLSFKAIKALDGRIIQTRDGHEFEIEFSTDYNQWLQAKERDVNNQTEEFNDRTVIKVGLEFDDVEDEQAGMGWWVLFLKDPVTQERVSKVYVQGEVGDNGNVYIKDNDLTAFNDPQLETEILDAVVGKIDKVLEERHGSEAVIRSSFEAFQKAMDGKMFSWDVGDNESINVRIKYSAHYGKFFIMLDEKDNPRLLSSDQWRSFREDPRDPGSTIPGALGQMMIYVAPVLENKIPDGRSLLEHMSVVVKEIQPNVQVLQMIGGNFLQGGNSASLNEWPKRALELVVRTAGETGFKDIYGYTQREIQKTYDREGKYLRARNLRVFYQIPYTVEGAKWVKRSGFARDEVLGTRDFYRRIDIRKYEEHLNKADRSLLERVQASDESLKEEDYQRLNEVLFYIVYPAASFNSERAVYVSDPLVSHEVSWIVTAKADQNPWVEKELWHRTIDSAELSQVHVLANGTKVLFSGSSAEIKSAIGAGAPFKVNEDGEFSAASINENGMYVFKTSLESVEEKLGAQAFEDVFRQAEENPKRIFTIVDWGVGKGLALKALEQRAMDRGLDNIRFVGFGNIYFPEWGQGASKITWILDDGKNFKKYFLNNDDKIDFMFSKIGLYHMKGLDRRDGVTGIQKHIDYMRDISDAMKPEGRIVYDYNMLGLGLKDLDGMGAVYAVDEYSLRKWVITLVKKPDLGGIDMKDIVISSADKSQTIQFDASMIEAMANKPVDGFVPVIISLTPVDDILPLLGLR